MTAVLFVIAHPIGLNKISPAEQSAGFACESFFASLKKEDMEDSQC